MFDFGQIPIAVKWAVGVLIAGFIAQFGRMLAEYLVRRFRKGKMTGGDAGTLDQGRDGQGELRHGDAASSAKARKKELKALQKLHKKRP